MKVQPTLIDERKPAPIDLGESPRILITRLSAIGDCILTWPMLTALKKAWPTSHITWVVDCAASQLLEKHPCVDEVIRLRKGFLLRPRELYSIRNELQKRCFQMVVDPQGLAKSALLAWLSNAPIRLGFDSCQSRECASFFYTAKRHPLSQHIVEKQLELLEMCYIDLPTTDDTGRMNVDFGWDDALLDSTEVDDAMDQLGLRAKQFVLMNPGAGWESKRWPLDRFSVLSEKIKEATGLTSVIAWGGERERDFARTIVALAPQSTVLAPPTNLVSLAQWCHRARLFVGSDTGPMHLAAAVGTPCVAMFGTSLPQRCGPYGAQHVSLQKRYDAGSARYRRSTTNAAMKAIEVDDAFQACFSIIEKRLGMQPSLKIAEISRSAA